jgi:hypothetical protein
MQIGNFYGYDVAKSLDAKGEPIRGNRTINQAEAEVVRASSVNMRQEPPRSRSPTVLNRMAIKSAAIVSLKSASLPPSLRGGSAKMLAPAIVIGEWKRPPPDRR